jgi:hypothetical protein
MRRAGVDDDDDGVTTYCCELPDKWYVVMRRRDIMIEGGEARGRLGGGCGP